MRKFFLLILIPFASVGFGGCASDSALDENDSVLRFSASVEDASCARAECVSGARRVNVGVSKAAENSVAESVVSNQTRCLPEGRPFGGGDGSVKSPYLVCSIDHWNRIADASSRAFELASDIDFRGTTPRRIARFSGELSGKNHILRRARWSVSAAEVDAVSAKVGQGRALFGGLFDRQEGYVRDLRIEHFLFEARARSGSAARVSFVALRNRGVMKGIRGGPGLRMDVLASPERVPASEREPDDEAPVSRWRIGGLAAENDGTLSDLAWQAMLHITVEADGVGVVVGANRGRIEDSRVSGRIDAPRADSVAVVAGESSGAIRKVKMLGLNRPGYWGDRDVAPSFVRARSRIGGLVGLNLSEVSMSRSWAKVEGEDSVGGLAGIVSGAASEIDECEFSGTVLARGNAGGLAGESRDGARIEGSFAQGSVQVDTLSSASESRSYAGGVVGVNDGARVVRSQSAGWVSARGRDTVSGGVVGANLATRVGRPARVESSSSTAKVYSQGWLGGVAGFNCSSCSVYASHARELPEGGPGIHCLRSDAGKSAVAGGIVGWNEGEISGAYSRATASQVSQDDTRCGQVGKWIGAGDFSRVTDLTSRAPAGE